MKHQNKSRLRKLSILDILSPIALFIYIFTDNVLTSVICALFILAHLSYSFIYLPVIQKRSSVPDPKHPDSDPLLTPPNHRTP